MGVELGTLSLHIPTQSANATDEWYIAIPWAGTWRLKKAMFAPATAVAIDGTDNLTATITGNNGAAGSDSSTIASHNTNTGGTALVLKTTVDLTLTQRMDFNEDYQIKVAKTLAGAGKILDGTYTFLFEKIN
jgi:hypothetical protein